MQEVSHSYNVWQNRNEIIQFTPELWFYDAFWLTSTNNLNFIAPEMHLMTSNWNLLNVISLSSTNILRKARG